MTKNAIKENMVIVAVFLVSYLQPKAYSQNLLDGPQKIVIDAIRNRLLVSNANSGDIIQIDSIGTQTYFVRGAGFIDGMEIVGDTVYGVGSNRKIKAYNLITGQLVLDITLQGAPDDYLSSIAFDSTGHLLISCPRLNEIYRMRINDLSYWVFARDNGLYKPNGILLEKEKNRIVVIDDSPDSKIHAINFADSSVSVLYATTFNSPDGIVRDKFGNYYIGGYYLKGLFKIGTESNKAIRPFVKGRSMVYPTYDESDHSILVTHYDANTWERIPLRK